MENFNQKFEDAILRLKIGEAQKQEFLSKLRTEGVTIGLVEAVKKAVADKIAQLEEEAQKKIDELQQEIEKASKDMTGEMMEIQATAKKEVERLEQEAKEKQVEDLRNKINSM